jgi:stage V sporulation protein D (sporulation-specific penicillin-binding protein)
MSRRCQIDLAEQKSRIRFLGIFFTFLFIIGIGRLFYLMVVKNSFYADAAASQHWAQDVVQPKRGKIYVRDEMTGGLYPLADNKKLSLVFVSPEEVENVDEVAERLSPIINVKKEKIISLIENNHTYVPLKNRLSYDVAEKIKSFNLKGVHLTSEMARYYPENELAAHVLGFVNDEGVGNYGLEQNFNKELTGQPGLYKAEIDPSGRRIAFGDKILKDATHGEDLILTINRDVQAEAERLLKRQVDRFSAEGGSIIVMNPNNGEILAMANAPGFDPNLFSAVKDYNLFINPAVQNLFEPGSIFKVLTMAAGLDAGKIEPDTEYNDTGSITLDGHKIMNSDKKANGLVTITKVLEQSLNTGTTFVMQQIGRASFFDYLKKFGFGEKTGIEQPNEASGKVYSPQEVNDHTYATISFGQSIAVTPIQMISSFAMIANGGKLVSPSLIDERVTPDGKVIKSKKDLGERVVSLEAATKLKKMMINVVENGHGQSAKVQGYKVAGKTGTAQVPRKDGLGYERGKNIGSFVGFGPAESPQYVVLAKVDSPKGTPWAESTAAPLVGGMLDFLFKYYQIPPSEN